MDRLQLLLLNILAVQFVTAINPGVKIKVFQSGLNYAASEALDVLSENVQGQAFPDQHGTSSVKVGKVEWWLSGIHVTSFRKPSSSVVVKPGAGITWTAHGADVGVHANWRYQYKLLFVKVKDSGSADVSVNQLDFSLSVRLGKDGSGRPTISATKCSSSIGNVKVHIHGGASWFYNLFSHFIAGGIKKNLQNQLCKSAENAINKDAAKTLAKLKLKMDMREVQLDYSLVEQPVFGQGYLETHHKGQFSWKKSNLEENMVEPPAFSTTSAGDRMISIWIGNYVMNSLGSVLQNHKVLMYNLTAQKLPKGYRDLLNTSCTSGQCIGTFLHQVRDLYPNSRMVLHARSLDPPTLNAIPNHLQSSFHGLIKFYVHLANGTEIYLFTTDMKINATLTAKVNGEHKIVAEVKKLIPKITVTDTKIKGVSSGSFNWMFNAISQVFIIPKLNDFGKEGIDIPNAKGVHFVNPKLSLTQGAVIVAADIKYQPNVLYFQPE